MAVKSAWGGGGVWGATASKAGDAADYEGEDACGICLNAPEAVSLQPCKHKICEACVARMRYQLISKASLHGHARWRMDVATRTHAGLNAQRMFWLAQAGTSCRHGQRLISAPWANAG